jgi:tetratricopeptide (TPR) repeat protein
LKISYNYDVPGIAKVYVEQTQKTDKVFKLPLAVDIYTAGKAERKNIWIENKLDSFSFAYTTKPELINVDADKILLAEKTDNKTEENILAQWKYAKTYLDRREALDFFAKKSMPEIAKGLNDKFAGLRQYTMQKLATTPYKKDAVVMETIESIAKTDKNKKTKAAAISYLVKNGDAKYAAIYQAAVSDSSYSVAGAALKGLVALDSANAYSLAKKYSSDAKGTLGATVNDILISQGTEADFAFIAEAYKKVNPDVTIELEKFKNTEDYENALKYYYKVEYEKPDNVKVCRPIAWCSFVQGKYDISMKYFFKVIANKPGKSDSLNIGNCYWALGLLDKALDSYRETIRLSGNDQNWFRQTFYIDSKYFKKTGISDLDVALMVDYVLLFI